MILFDICCCGEKREHFTRMKLKENKKVETNEWMKSGKFCYFIWSVESHHGWELKAKELIRVFRSLIFETAEVTTLSTHKQSKKTYNMEMEPMRKTLGEIWWCVWSCGQCIKKFKSESSKVTYFWTIGYEFKFEWMSEWYNRKGPFLRWAMKIH